MKASGGLITYAAVIVSDNPVGGIYVRSPLPACMLWSDPSTAVIIVRPSRTPVFQYASDCQVPLPLAEHVTLRFLLYHNFCGVLKRQKSVLIRT